MKEVEELNLPDGLGYTDDHEWAQITGATVRIGVSDYAQGGDPDRPRRSDTAGRPNE